VVRIVGAQPHTAVRAAADPAPFPRFWARRFISSIVSSRDRPRLRCRTASRNLLPRSASSLRFSSAEADSYASATSALTRRLVVFVSTAEFPSRGGRHFALPLQRECCFCSAITRKLT
jgi:hypothetical protein